MNAVALVRSGASQSLLDLDGVLRVMKDDVRMVRHKLKHKITQKLHMAKRLAILHS